MQCLGGEIGEDDFVHALHHPIGNGFTNLYACNLLHGGSDALDVLHVHGRKYIDLGLQQFHDVLIALGVLAALNVGMGQLVDHDHGRFAAENGVHVHLFKRCAFVLKFARRDAFEFCGEFGGGLATVTLHHAYSNVFSAAGTANGLAQHAVSLAHAGSVAEEKLEDSARLFRRDFTKPLLGRLGHCSYCLSRGRYCHVHRTMRG